MVLKTRILRTCCRRAVAGLVVVTFTAGTLQPLTVLAKDADELGVQLAQAVAPAATKNPQQVSTANPATAASRAAAKLTEVHDALKELAPEASRDDRALSPGQLERVRRSDEMIRPKGSNRGQKIATLRQLLNDVRSGRAAMRASLDEVEADLLRRGAPAEILARQRQAVQDFETRADEFEALADRLGKAAITQEQGVLDEMAGFFRRYPAARPHTAVDPDKLPLGKPRLASGQPAETAAQLERELFGEPVRLASTSGVHSLGLNSSAILAAQISAGPTPTTSDLAESDDVQLTAAIRAKAQELGNNPVQITNWVRNTIEWIPSWGSIQGAEFTLKTRRGNAIDTASLTIALLRAAGIPARYVIGTIEVDAARLNNWVGGADKVESAISLMGQGGIATTALIAGGTIVKVRMQHAWVQVYANWVPSRGAKNFSNAQHQNANPQLNAWVDVDTSYKQYAFSTPIELKSAVPFDAAAVRNTVMTAGTVETTQGFIEGFSETAAADQIRAYGERVQSYLESRPELKLSDLVRTRRIQADAPSILAGTLAVKTVTGTAVALLPASLRHYATINLYASALDRALDAPVLTHRISLPALGNRRLGVTYEPASAADAQVIDDAVASGTAALPAYLVSLRPALQIDGRTVAAGPVATMGSEQLWTVSFLDPAGVNSGDANFTNFAGDEIVFGINGNGISPQVVVDRYVNGQPNTAAGNLEQAALMYWLEHDYFDQMAAAQLGVLTMRMPSAAQMAAPLTVSYYFGIARSATYQSRSGDGKRVLVAVAGRDESTRRQFMLLAGMQGSAVEGSVFDQLMSRPDETSVSTTQYFAIAARQGLRIFAITTENIGTVLPQIATSASVKNDIANAINAGHVAFVPEADLTHKGFTGIGYLLLDPQTGAGAYLIDGGRNGLNTPDCKGAARPQSVEISLQSLLAWQTLAPALLGFSGPPGTAEERAAYEVAREAIELAAKTAAERIVRSLAPRMLAAIAIPGANIVLPVAVATAISIEILLVTYQLKMLMAELEIQTRARTEEDLRCKCENNSGLPECECRKEPYPHQPIRVVPARNVYDVRVDTHHTCADVSGNSYGGRDVMLISPRAGSVSVDLFSEPNQLACEVKISFKNEPYDSYVLANWLTSTIAQLTRQRDIATSCGWRHCVIVNKQWMQQLFADAGFNVILKESCSATTVPSDPFEIPETPLDRD